MFCANLLGLYSWSTASATCSLGHVCLFATAPRGPMDQKPAVQLIHKYQMRRNLTPIIKRGNGKSLKIPYKSGFLTGESWKIIFNCYVTGVKFLCPVAIRQGDLQKKSGGRSSKVWDLRRSAQRIFRGELISWSLWPSLQTSLGRHHPLSIQWLGGS